MWRKCGAVEKFHWPPAPKYQLWIEQWTIALNQPNSVIIVWLWQNEFSVTPLTLAGAAQVSVAWSTQAVAHSVSNILHPESWCRSCSSMSVSYIVLPPHCAKYPCFSSHHFLLVPLTACTSAVHYSSLCLSTRQAALLPHPIRSRNTGITLELQLLDMWFFSLRGGKGLTYSWAPLPFYFLLHWISTNPHSSISTLPSTLY